jgi:hypothetical protein
MQQLSYKSGKTFASTVFQPRNPVNNRLAMLFIG